MFRLVATLLSVSNTSALEALIELSATSVRPGEELGYRIKNTGSVGLMCGLAYRLERESGDGWVGMNDGQAFRAIGFPILPGQSRELKAKIPVDAPPGSYRLSASVRSDYVAGSIRLSALFDVLGDG